MLKQMPITKFHRDYSRPEWGEVFVFETSRRGIHMPPSGPASPSRYGAMDGIAEGRVNNSYAIPTADEELESLSLERIRQSVDEFLAHATAMFGKDQFFIGHIGEKTGYDAKSIAPMFRKAPINCSFAEEWRPYLT